MKSYFKLLQTHRSLYFLWQGMLLSSIGDWCRHVSIIALVIKLTGTGMEMAIVLVLEIIPLLFASPIAGGIIDRFDVRKLVIVADICRALLTLCFLAVDSTDRIWLVYGLTASISVIDIFFLASRQVLLSNIVPQNRLIIANSLFTLTSGFCLAGGSLLAVYIMTTYGMTLAFIFDSLTFIVSGLLVLGIKDFQRSLGHCCSSGNNVLDYYADIKDWIRYLRSNPNVYSLLIFNVLRFAGSGSMYMLLGVFGAKVFHAGDSGVSAFYASFGAGFFLGGIVAKKVSEMSSNLNYYLLIGIAALIEGVFVMIFSQIAVMSLSLVILALSFLSRALFVTFYNSLMMYLVADNFKGRVFVADKMFSYTIMGLAMIACGWGLSIVSPRHLALMTGGFLSLNGVQWLITTSRRGIFIRFPHFAPALQEQMENKK